MKYLKDYNTKLESLSDIKFEQRFEHCLNPLLELNDITEKDCKNGINKIKLVNEDFGFTALLSFILTMPKILMLSGVVVNLIKKVLKPNSDSSKVAKWLLTKGHKLNSKFLGAIKSILKWSMKSKFLDENGELDEVKLERFARGVFAGILTLATLNSGMTTIEDIEKEASKKALELGVKTGAKDIAQDVSMDDILKGIEQTETLLK